MEMGPAVLPGSRSFKHRHYFFLCWFSGIAAGPETARPHGSRAEPTDTADEGIQYPALLLLLWVSLPCLY